MRLLGVVRGRCAPTVRACFRFENREKQETSEGKEYRMDRAIFIDKRIPDK